MYFISAILFFFIAIGVYDSASGYVEYFFKSDIISFSFVVGFLIFCFPFLSWLSYLIFMVAYKKRKLKVNNKITNSLAVIAMFGIVFSFVFSFYVEYDLTSRGYVKCYKKSIHAPTKYVISKDMCK
ncbi:TPA: DUF1240 domain-containing protein [Morganella morganii]|nr:DUF1240 domain-containing protein [Morganella morganii]